MINNVIESDDMIRIEMVEHVPLITCAQLTYSARLAQLVKGLATQTHTRSNVQEVRVRFSVSIPSGSIK